QLAVADALRLERELGGAGEVGEGQPEVFGLKRGRAYLGDSPVVNDHAALAPGGDTRRPAQQDGSHEKSGHEQLPPWNTVDGDSAFRCLPLWYLPVRCHPGPSPSSACV